MNKLLVLIPLIFVSCIEFEFESPYEDLNGIYLDWIRSYDYQGRKLTAENQKLYLMWSLFNTITNYDISNVYSISVVSSYTSQYELADFEIQSDYAYIVSWDYGLEIVNFQGTEPHLLSSLEITNGADKVRFYENHAYVASSDNFYVIDVSDKTNPKKVGEYSFGSDSYVIYMEVESNFAHILIGPDSDFYVLDIADPTDPNAISQVSLQNTLGPVTMFSSRGSYLYFLRDRIIETHEVSEVGNLEYISKTHFSALLSFIITYEGNNYGLAFLEDYLAVYLLNLENPARPCISEAFYDFDYVPDYGIIEDPYIFLLTPYLTILEIKEIEE